MGGLTARERDRDMPHRRIGFGAMPMPFTGLDMDDVADLDLALFVFGRHRPGARCHNPHLVAVMGMPSGRGALAEVDNAAVVVRRVSRLNDGLARSGDRAGISLDRLGAFHRYIRDVFESDHLHNDSPFF